VGLLEEDTRPRAAPRERGGVLLRLRGVDADAMRAPLGFVPADVARRLSSLSSLTPVPGARPPAFGIALAEGAVVTVLNLGNAPYDAPPEGAEGRAPYTPDEDWVVPGADRALLCRLGAFDVALTGATVLATGVFDVAPDESGVLWRGEVVPVIDVRALYAQAEAATWAERAVPSTHPPGKSRSVRPPPVAPPAPEEGARHAILPGALGGDGDEGR
jgi:hypothetical protein